MTTPQPRPVRYVVPYHDDGSFPQVYEWFEGITGGQDETGAWIGHPVTYEEADTWTRAKGRVEAELKREARLIREARARWRDAGPEKAVKPHGRD